MKKFNIKTDIRQAYTLPSSFYKSQHIFGHSKAQIFDATWQYVADASVVAKPGQVYPFTLLKDVIDEPLLFSRDKDNQVHCLSNVCTHRGKIIVEKAGDSRMLSCGYHGRCFRLDGSFKSMPEFEETENFPTEDDHLSKVPFAEWIGLLFVSPNPAVSFEEMIVPIQERIGWMPLNTLEYSKTGSKDYFVKAHWALYCDNYLEGFHIPFVHPALNEALDFGNYQYEIFPYCNLQLGIAKDGEPCFDIPEGAIDYGKKVYAYYFWLFPNLMLNFYPWGLSLNIIQPLNHKETKVTFRTYRFAGVTLDQSVHNIDDTEMEDEQVVESVQLGIQSRYYKKGRFSPTMEQGVHHFHSLIAKFMD